MSTKNRKTKASRKSKLDPKKVGQAAFVADEMANAPAGAQPPILGSRTRIWKQDPSVEIATRDVYVHTRIHAGPADSQIEIEGLPIVHPDVNGDFLFEPASENAFDAVHTYTIVRQVLTMFQRALSEKMKWQWNTGGNSAPISVFPNAGETPNAFYSRNERALKFFFFRPAGAGPNAPFVFTCRSLDIVAHEAGHAILDSLQPGWITSFDPQTGGLPRGDWRFDFNFPNSCSVWIRLNTSSLRQRLICTKKTSCQLSRSSLEQRLGGPMVLGMRITI